MEVFIVCIKLVHCICQVSFGSKLDDRRASTSTQNGQQDLRIRKASWLRAEGLWCRLLILNPGDDTTITCFDAWLSASH
ncbi:unnamed protein product [Caretta caretta]